MDSSQVMQIDLVDDSVELTLVELCRAARAAEEEVRVWVVQGVLTPRGTSPAEWRFAGGSLRRARMARSLARDLEINTPGIALALDLMDEIESLRAALRRGGAR